jgi:hypothetical protein
MTYPPLTQSQLADERSLARAANDSLALARIDSELAALRLQLPAPDLLLNAMSVDERAEYDRYLAHVRHVPLLRLSS